MIDLFPSKVDPEIKLDEESENHVPKVSKLSYPRPYLTKIGEGEICNPPHLQITRDSKNLISPNLLRLEIRRSENP